MYACWTHSRSRVSRQPGSGTVVAGPDAQHSICEHHESPRPLAVFDRRYRRSDYDPDMDGSRVRTAADVERLSPDERHRLVDEATVMDLASVSAEFLARARADGRRLLAERGVIDAEQ
ncbi:hypothetical protein BH24ACT5_BH24ACT5_09810 [soil metagenome]